MKKSLTIYWERINMGLLDKIKEKNCRVIVCNVDGISGYFFKALILEVLEKKFYWEYYSLIHSLYKDYQQYIGGTLEESEIPDSEMIKFWIQNTKYPIISTCWDYERTIKAVKEAKLDTTIRIYDWMPKTEVNESLPF